MRSANPTPGDGGPVLATTTPALATPSGRRADVRAAATRAALFAAALAGGLAGCASPTTPPDGGAPSTTPAPYGPPRSRPVTPLPTRAADVAQAASRPLPAEPGALARLHVVEPSRGRRMSDRLDAVRGLRERVGNTVPVMGWVEGALAEAADLRGVSTLLLDLYDIHPDYTRAIPNDWYRQALEYRVPRGEGEALRAALGSVQRSQFSRIQALLRLPDSVWELADRHRLEEKRLRYVLKVEDEALQVQLVRFLVARDLSAERVRQLAESPNLAALLSDGPSRAGAEDFAETVSERVANRWPALARQFSQADLSLVADQWLKRQKPEDVRRQVAALRRLLEIVERQVPGSDP